MRALVLAVALGLVFAASTQAAPLSPQPAAIELGAASPIQLVDHGWGWQRVHWQDHWGYWHWHCVPYGHAYHGRINLEHPYADRRGPTGGFGNP
jgi:hypothetical protein